MGLPIRTEPFDEVEADVAEGIAATIEAARAVGLPLEDVRTVVTGDRELVGKLMLPAVWVIAGPHIPEFLGFTEVVHDFAYDLVGMVQGGKDTSAAKRDASNLAGRLFAVMIADRSLGNRIHDIRPLRWDPAYRADGSSNIHYASVMLAFRVRIRH